MLVWSFFSRLQATSRSQLIAKHKQTTHWDLHYTNSPALSFWVSYTVFLLLLYNQDTRIDSTSRSHQTNISTPLVHVPPSLPSVAYFVPFANKQLPNQSFRSLRFYTQRLKFSSAFVEPPTLMLYCSCTGSQLAVTRDFRSMFVWVKTRILTSVCISLP